MVKNPYRLEFSMRLQPTARLLVGNLVMLKNEQLLKSWRSTTSYPGKQYRYSWREIGGVLPPDEPYTVSTTAIFMPKVRGVQGNFYQILPFAIDTLGDTRADFGIHADRNVPGTRGCIGVLETQGPKSWDDFRATMKAIASEGFDKVPLKVSYTF